MDPNSAYQNYLSSMNQYLGYNPTTSQDITKQLMNKVNNLQPQYTELGNAQTSAQAAPAEMMANYQNTYGTNSGPDVFTRAQNALTEMGNRQTTATALGNSINAEQGRIGDLGTSVLGAYNQARDAAGNVMNNNAGIYNTQLSTQAQLQAAQTAAGAQEYAAKLQNQLGVSQMMNTIKQNLATTGLQGQFDANGNLIPGSVVSITTGQPVQTDASGKPTGAGAPMPTQATPTGSTPVYGPNGQLLGYYKQ